MMAPLSTESAAGVAFSSQSTVKPCGDMAAMRAVFPRVVPANAGTHKHRRSLFGVIRPQVANIFRITLTEVMGPGVRLDDV
jgi:hypothetical protein